MVLSAVIHIHACPSYNPKLQGFRWSQSRPPDFTYSKKPSLMNSIWLNDASVCCFWLSLCSWWSVGPSDSLRESTVLYHWFLTHIPSGVDLLFRECNAPPAHSFPRHERAVRGNFPVYTELPGVQKSIAALQYMQSENRTTVAHLLQMRRRIIKAKPDNDGALLRQAYFSTSWNEN